MTKSKNEISIKAAAEEAIAKQKIKELEEYYGEPVLPMSQYCDAFITWANCIMNAHKEGKKNGYSSHGSSYAEHLDRILIDIQKSNLLARLLYSKLPLRTKKCPEHNGHWSGCRLEPCPHGCSYGYDVTGWLPNDEEKTNE